MKITDSVVDKTQVQVTYVISLAIEKENEPDKLYEAEFSVTITEQINFGYEDLHIEFLNGEEFFTEEEIEEMKEVIEEMVSNDERLT